MRRRLSQIEWEVGAQEQRDGFTSQWTQIPALRLPSGCDVCKPFYALGIITSEANEMKVF